MPRVSYHLKYRAPQYFVVIIPPKIMADPRLWWYDKLIYGFFMGTRVEDGYSLKSTWDISRCLDLSEKNVWSAMARLQKYHLLKREFDHGYGRVKYYKTYPQVTDLEPTSIDMTAYDPLIDDKNFNFSRDLAEYSKHDR